jgi:acetyltransferase-like isoleucine patch superfamily enzyme
MTSLSRSSAEGAAMIGGDSANRREQFGERLFNYLITHIPSHTIRQAWLRYFGAKIGRDTTLCMGLKVFRPSRLEIGNNCSLGFDIVLDARGGLVIDDDVVLASDVHIITGQHVIDSDDFAINFSPVRIKHHAWLTSRATVLPGVTIGAGAVLGACSVLESDLEDMSIAVGMPAKVRATRKSSLEYHLAWRPLFF